SAPASERCGTAVPCGLSALLRLERISNGCAPGDVHPLASQGFPILLARESAGGSRPALRKEIRQLIARMVKENITWGEERIADELSLKLGICVSPRTVRKYWPKQLDGAARTRTSSQHWSTFVRNHAHGIVACDFLVAVTLQ